MSTPEIPLRPENVFHDTTLIDPTHMTERNGRISREYHCKSGDSLTVFHVDQRMTDPPIQAYLGRIGERDVIIVAPHNADGNFTMGDIHSLAITGYQSKNQLPVEVFAERVGYVAGHDIVVNGLMLRGYGQVTMRPFPHQMEGLVVVGHNELNEEQIQAIYDKPDGQHGKIDVEEGDTATVDFGSTRLPYSLTIPMGGDMGTIFWYYEQQ